MTTYYHKEVLRLRKQLYSKDYLCEQAKQAKLFIDDHFSDNISLDDMAAKACLSKFHFIRVFKNLYGRTPNQYLVAVRINAAKHLLKSGMSINEVCSSIGFDSSTTFSGLFRRMTGDTPVIYQRKKLPGSPEVKKQDGVFASLFGRRVPRRRAEFHRALID